MSTAISMSAPVSYSTTPLGGSNNNQAGASASTAVPSSQLSSPSKPLPGYLSGAAPFNETDIEIINTNPFNSEVPSGCTGVAKRSYMSTSWGPSVYMDKKSSEHFGNLIVSAGFSGFCYFMSTKASNPDSRYEWDYISVMFGIWATYELIAGTVGLDLSFKLPPSKKAIESNKRYVDSFNRIASFYNTECARQHAIDEANRKMAAEAAAAAERARQAAIAADKAAKAPTLLQLEKTVEMLRCLEGQGYNCSFKSPIISGPLRARIEKLLVSLEQLKKEAENLSMTPKSFKKKLIPLISMANILKNDCFAFNKKMILRQDRADALIDKYMNLSCSSLCDPQALRNALKNSSETGNLSIFDREYQKGLRLYQILSVKCPEMDRMVSRYEQYGCGESGAVSSKLYSILENCIQDDDFSAFDSAISKADGKLSNIIAKAKRRLEQVNNLERYLISKKVKMGRAGIFNMYKSINEEIQALKDKAKCSDVSDDIRAITSKISGNVAIGALIKYIDDFERDNSNPPALEVTAPAITNFFLILGSAKDTPQGVCVKVEFAYIRNQEEEKAYSKVHTIYYDESSETWRETGQIDYLRRTIGRTIYNWIAGYFKAAIILDFMAWLTL